MIQRYSVPYMGHPYQALKGPWVMKIDHLAEVDAKVKDAKRDQRKEIAQLVAGLDEHYHMGEIAEIIRKGKE